MSFIKELVSEEHEKLYLSFEMYDYDRQDVHGLTAYTTWAADHEREIYFTYISGGALEHPKQYDLIWQNKKIVIFTETNIERNPLTDNPMHLICHYNIISIRSPKEFMARQSEMLELIKEAFEAYHSIDIIKGVSYRNKNTMIIDRIAVPKYYDEVK